MSIFAHPHAIAAASKPVAKCANCSHNEVVIVDLQAWVDDLRQSRDQWRELALDAGWTASSPNTQPWKPPDTEGDPSLKG